MTRYDLLRAWLRERNVTFTWLGERLGRTETTLRQMVMRDHMPVEMHAAMVDLGIPAHLLPEPQQRQRRRKIVPMLDADGRIMQVLPGQK